MGFDPRTCLDLLRKAEPAQSFGKVNKVVGLVAEAGGISASLGAVCHILPDDGGDPIAAEVVGFRDGNLLFMPYGEMRGVRPGSLIRNSSLPPVFPVGPGLLGRAFKTLAATGLYLCNPLSDLVDLFIDKPFLTLPAYGDTLKLAVSHDNGIIITRRNTSAEFLSVMGLKVLFCGEMCIRDSAGTRHRSFSFLPAISRTPSATL